MGRLAPSWDEISVRPFTLDLVFMNLLRAAAQRLGMEVDAFMAETLRERAMTVLNEALPGHDPATDGDDSLATGLITAPASPPVDSERDKAEAKRQALLEHTAIVAAIAEKERSGKRGRGSADAWQFLQQYLPSQDHAKQQEVISTAKDRLQV